MILKQQQKRSYKQPASDLHSSFTDGVPLFGGYLRNNYQPQPAGAQEVQFI